MAAGAEYVGTDRLSRLRDFERFAHRTGGQSHRGGRQQHQAGSFARPQPGQIVIGLGAERDHDRVVLTGRALRRLFQRRAGERPRRDQRGRVRINSVAGRDTGHRPVAPTPCAQLGHVVGIGGMRGRRLRNDLVQPWQQVDLTQHHPGAGRPGSHQRDIPPRHRPGTVVAAISAAPTYRGREHDIEFAGRLADHLDRGQVIGVSRIGQPVNLGVPAHRGQPNHAVVQGGTAAEQ